MPLDRRTPLAYLRDRLRGADLPGTRPLPRPTAGPAAGRPARRPGAAHLSATSAPAYSFAPDGERTVARGYTKAVAPGPAADLPGGPVPLVDGGRPSCSPPRCASTRTCTWSPSCRATRTSTAGWRCRRTWSAASRRCDVLPAGRPGPGARLRRGEPQRHAGLRARQGLRGRRRLGQRRQRQLQPPLLDPRQRAVLRGARRHPRRAGAPRPGRARRRRPGVRPRPAAAAAARAPGPDPDGAEDDDLLDPDAAVRAITAAADALDAGTTGGRRGPRPPGRLRPHRPGAAGPLHPALGAAGVPAGLRPGRPIVSRPTRRHWSSANCCSAASHISYWWNARNRCWQ